MNPIPVRARLRPPDLASGVRWEGSPEGCMLLLDVYRGLEGMERSTVKRLRIVGVPAKTQPTMNSPAIGITHDDPGKFVLGTVPVEKDGSAYFRVPSGVPFFFQALDAEGMAVQTMRSATYAQPGQTTTCIGCHEPRRTSPPNSSPLAARREASRISPGPEGSWPLDFRSLVGPVIEKRCRGCHKPGAPGAKFDLTPDPAYETLISYGGESIRTQVLASYRLGRSRPGTASARASPVVALLKNGHQGVRLEAEEMERLVTWIDTYAQRSGSFSPEQEEELRELRRRMREILK
jgi:cytochrome c553